MIPSPFFVNGFLSLSRPFPQHLSGFFRIGYTVCPVYSLWIKRAVRIVLRALVAECGMNRSWRSLEQDFWAADKRRLTQINPVLSALICVHLRPIRFFSACDGRGSVASPGGTLQARGSPKANVPQNDGAPLVAGPRRDRMRKCNFRPESASTSSKNFSAGACRTCTARATPSSAAPSR